MTTQELNAKFNKVLQDNLGKPVEVVDPTNRDQCFDWAVKVCLAYGLPITIFAGLLNASQIWTNPTALSKQNFDFIPNSPTFVPSKGDICVFAGIPGHVSVATGVGDTNTFQSSDQNWAGKQFITLVTHNYDNPQLLGVLRLKTTSVTSSPQPMANDLQVKKSVQVDRIASWLKDQGYATDSGTEQYFNNEADPDKFFNKIKSVVAGLKDQGASQQKIDNAYKQGKTDGRKEIRDAVAKAIL